LEHALWVKMIFKKNSRKKTGGKGSLLTAYWPDPSRRKARPLPRRNLKQSRPDIPLIDRSLNPAATGI
jgi:hypothetical protein